MRSLPLTINQKIFQGVKINKNNMKVTVSSLLLLWNIMGEWGDGESDREGTEWKISSTDRAENNTMLLCGSFDTSTSSKRVIKQTKKD